MTAWTAPEANIVTLLDKLTTQVCILDDLMIKEGLLGKIGKFCPSITENIKSNEKFFDLGTNL